MLKHYTIELRTSADSTDTVSKEMDKVVREAATHLHAVAILLLPPASYAQVACFSDDFFDGPKEVTEYAYKSIGGYEG